MTNESLNTQPDYYHEAPFNGMEAQGYICKNFYQAITKEQSLTLTGEIDAQARTWAVGAAAKHLIRLGKKDDTNFELQKIENYAHYARTSKWQLNKKQLTNLLMETIETTRELECQGNIESLVNYAVKRILGEC